MKLVASDYDGTLVFSNWDDPVFIKNLPISDNEYNKCDELAINSFISKGNVFGICTGRGIFEMQMSLMNCPFDYYIVNSGTLILDKNFKPLWYAKMDKKAVVEAIKEVKKLNLKAICMIHTVLTTRFIQLDVGTCSEELVSEDSVVEDIVGLSYQFFSTEDYQKAYEVLYKGYKDKMAIYPNKLFIDSVEAGYSKATGVRWIQNYFNVEDKDVNVIGDEINDIPMLSQYENSFTFNRSKIQVKEVAKYTVNYVSEALEIIEK